MYDIKALYEPKSPEEAVQLKLAHPEAHFIAGGSDVLIKLREGHLAGCELISIYLLDELRGVELLQDGTLRIGSLTSFSHVAKNELVLKHIPVLAEAVNLVGGPQVRNIGTVGGNTCNGVTSADSGATLLALDADVELLGPEGKRVLPLEKFYLGAGRVDLRPGELQLALLVKKEAYEGYHGAYIKYAMRNAMDIATLACSANVRLSGDKRSFESVRLAYGVAGPVPLRTRTAEELAKGLPLTEASIKKIAKATLEDVKPRDSWRASKAFRLHLIRTLAERALTESVKRAGAELLREE